MSTQAMENSDYHFTDDLKKAVDLHREGSLDKARRHYLRILEQHPNQPDALHLLGVIAYQTGDFDRSIELIRQAIRLDPNQSIFYLNLGNAYRENQDDDHAQKCYLKAIALNPANADVHYNLGNTLASCGNLDSAIACYHSAIRLNPHLTEAYYNLGCVFERQGKPNQAVSFYQRAVQIQSDFVAAHVRLGTLYQKLGNHQAAVRSFFEVLGTHPEDGFRMYNNMGVSLQAIGKLDDAVSCFEKAAKLNPDYATAYFNLGIANHSRGELNKSITALNKAIELKPDHSGAYNLLVNVLQKTCDWQKLAQASPKLDGLTQAALDSRMPTAEAVFSNVSRHADPSLNFALARARSREIAEQVSDIQANFNFDQFTSGADKIILGYFSEDVRDHPIAHLTRGLFKLHNRDVFKVHCYSYGKDDGSIYRAQIAEDCDRFVDVRDMNTLDVAFQIYRDKVGILVELGGHTAGNRLNVCALRPAPIQVTYLGFPGTTGADFIDYIITDKIVSPEAHKPFYSEQFVYMPHCYQVNNNHQEIAAEDRRRIDFGLPEDGFVYASFTQPFKIEAVMFSSWMNILKKVPGSILWLLWDNSIAEENLRQAAREMGVDANRIFFAQKMSKEKHLARVRLADLILDTRIYNGHTTTSDCLWAGVPVITLQGTHFASRVSASLLYAVGLSELVTSSLEGYEELAVDMARHPGKLQAIRRKLLTSRQLAPLFDTERFVRNLEIAYKEMWEIFRNGGKPRRIRVTARGNL